MNAPHQTLSRRTVKTITETWPPKKIYQLIQQKEIEYSPEHQQAYTCENRAYLALSYLTGSRVTELCGGIQRKIWGYNGNEPIELKVPNKDHQGIQRENIVITPKWIEINNLPVVKRSQKVIDKYGPHIAQRPQLIYPLDPKLNENKYYQQWIPFTYLFLEFLEKYAPAKGKLFRFRDSQAWRITNQLTGYYPNFMRAQASRFHINYLETDSVQHARYMRRMDPKSAMVYIDYDSKKNFTNPEEAMSFEWISTEVEKIKNRMA